MDKSESCTGATGGGLCSCRNEQNSNLAALLNWNLLASNLVKNSTVTIDIAKYKDVLLSFGVTNTPYTLDSILIPASDITRGFYSLSTCSHTIYYGTSYARIDFTITTAGVLTVTNVTSSATSGWSPCISRVNVR